MHQPRINRKKNKCLNGTQINQHINNAYNYISPKYIDDGRAKFDEVGKIFQFDELKKKTYITFKEGYLFRESIIELMQINTNNMQKKTNSKIVGLESLFNNEQDFDERELIQIGN